MFGSSSNSSSHKSDNDSKSNKSSPETSPAPTPTKATDQAASGEKRSGNGSPPTRQDTGGSTDKKRRSSSVSSKASSLLASARNSLSFSQGGRGVVPTEMASQSPLQKLGKQDPALAVPQGQHNNSAGDSVPGPKSTFRVGVWEDRNKKCRRTMEDTHAFLYNFIQTPPQTDASSKDTAEGEEAESAVQEMVESDNGYFAIFDGHAGTFAADWCGKKLHIILEELIRNNPNAQIPEVLDLAFTTADAQLEKLPLKNSGCTAAVAVLRWEDRPSGDRSGIDSASAQKQPNNKADDSSSQSDKEKSKDSAGANEVQKTSSAEGINTKPKATSTRQRVLYTANVGDARIILCRAGKALRLSYDHKGSDELEGKRISNAGGLILNNRVNGVLAVTRALGDAYMKKLVTGHPYTTETVIQPDSDEFIIIACDGLWDVCTDQEAVDLVRNLEDPVVASKLLVDHALNRFSTDNLSCMIVRLDSNQPNDATAIGDGTSEADKIVKDTKKKVADGALPAEGVSATSNSSPDGEFVPTSIDEVVLEEEPDPVEERLKPETTSEAEKPAEKA
ncbi:phosphatase 2C-like domain-containing protein [Mariannaea sp. PMI_226]|nr:phosphatase 2C-like domain-containing protein [Mariannaea sp. PMI_226]